jgi:membrane protease YdiL (CAAX protease family)
VHSPEKHRDLRLFWLPFAMIAVNLGSGFADLGIGRVAYFLLLAAMIGFVEEGVVRGLILRAVVPRGPWKAVIVSTVLFDLLHSMNVAAGADVLATILQIGYGLAIGFGFAAVALRTKMI